MRKLLLALALAAVLPVQAANLKWAAQNDILTLDPHSQNHATTISLLQHAYEPLVRYNKNFQVEPCLAASWQALSPTQYRFMLRKGVRFHDGSPFTADDVVFSFGRIKQPQGTMQPYVAGVKPCQLMCADSVEPAWCGTSERSSVRPTRVRKGPSVSHERGAAAVAAEAEGAGPVSEAPTAGRVSGTATRTITP